MPNVAVIGCGGWGRNLVRTFHRLGALKAVCDIDAERGQSISSTFGVPLCDVEDLVRSAEIDAVVIATPADDHASVALDALRGGKHVFIEKPMALTVQEALTVRDAGNRAGRVVMVGHLLQYHPGFIALKRTVEEGTLGRIQYIYSNRLNFGKVRKKENVFWSFAPHDISMILSLTGEMPVSVETHGSYYLNRSVSDVTTTHMRFPNGIDAHIFVSWLHPVKEQRLVVVGETGMAVFDDMRPWPSKLLFYPHRVDWRNGEPELKSAPGQPVPLEEEEPLLRECRHFLECAATGIRPVTDAEEGIRVLEVLSRSEVSLERKRSEAIPMAGAR
jgi:predicted dehydrogenase